MMFSFVFKQGPPGISKTGPPGPPGPPGQSYGYPMTDFGSGAGEDLMVDIILTM